MVETYDRSETISKNPRKRRDQSIDRRLRDKVREAKARGTSYDPRRVPPVMVRSGALDDALPFRKPAKSKARRRFDVSLGIPGAEMRLPSIPQISIDMRLISGLLAIALAFVVYHFWNSPSFRVQEAEIVGLQRLNSRDVNTVLNINEDPIFAVDPELVAQRARDAFPEFSSINVGVSLPNTVVVTVEERQPILTWKQDGRTVLVDAYGVAFPQREMSGAAPSLVVEAVSSPPAGPSKDILEGSSSAFMRVEMVSAILSMSAQAPKDTPLAYDSRHGLGWKDARGWEVYFGDVNEIELKLRVYQAMIKQLQKDKLSPVLVSVEHPHKPYYRLER